MVGAAPAGTTPKSDGLSFEEYLQELADPETQFSVSKLVRLSGLTPDEAARLADLWPELELRRRRRLVEELLDVAEDSVDQDYDRVFFIALADRDAEVRRHAIKGLWEHEGRDLAEELLRLLRDDADAAVRAEAAIALGRFAVQAEFGALPATDAERIDHGLRDTVNDTQEIVEVRGRALESLGARSLPWVPDLIEEMFDSGDRRLRLSAVHAMGRSCDAVWLPMLLGELEDSDAELRFEVAGAIGSIADESAAPQLLALLDDEDAEVQEAAIGALGEIGGTEAKEALVELQAEGDERLQDAAHAALEALDVAQDPLGVQLREQTNGGEPDP